MNLKIKAGMQWFAAKFSHHLLTYMTRLPNDSGSKLRVDNLHYDLTEQDLKVCFFSGKSMTTIADQAS